MTVEAIWVQWTQCHVTLLSCKNGHGQKLYLGRLEFKLCSIGTKYAKKISPTPWHHHHQPEPLRQGRIDPCFHVVYDKFWSYAAECRSRNRDSSDQAKCFQSFIDQCCLCEELEQTKTVSTHSKLKCWHSKCKSVGKRKGQFNGCLGSYHLKAKLIKGRVGKNGETSSSKLYFESTHPKINLPLPSDFLTEPHLQHTRTCTWPMRSRDKFVYEMEGWQAGRPRLQQMKYLYIFIVKALMYSLLSGC